MTESGCETMVMNQIVLTTSDQEYVLVTGRQHDLVHDHRLASRLRHRRPAPAQAQRQVGRPSLLSNRLTRSDTGGDRRANHLCTRHGDRPHRHARLRRVRFLRHRDDQDVGPGSTGLPQALAAGREVGKLPTIAKLVEWLRRRHSLPLGMSTDSPNDPTWLAVEANQQDWIELYGAADNKVGRRAFQFHRISHTIQRYFSTRFSRNTCRPPGGNS